MIAPTAYHKLAHPDGEAATVRGAAGGRRHRVRATLATTSLEDARPRRRRRPSGSSSTSIATPA